MSLFDERFRYFGGWKGSEETTRVWYGGRASVRLVVASRWSVVPNVSKIGIDWKCVGRWGCVWWWLEGSIPGKQRRRRGS